MSPAWFENDLKQIFDLHPLALRLPPHKIKREKKSKILEKKCTLLI